MPPQKGRPPADNPKSTMIRVRMDEEDVELMDGCAMALETTRSDVIRKGIKRLAEDIETGRYPKNDENNIKEE